MLSLEDIFSRYLNLVKKFEKNHYDEHTDVIYAAYNTYVNKPSWYLLSNLIHKDFRLKEKDKDLLIANIFLLDIKNSLSDPIQLNENTKTITVQQLKKNDLFIWGENLSTCTSTLSDGNITIADVIDNNYSLLDNSKKVSEKCFDSFNCFKIGTFKL